jgi:hypothetical protein
MLPRAYSEPSPSRFVDVRRELRSPPVIPRNVYVQESHRAPRSVSSNNSAHGSTTRTQPLQPRAVRVGEHSPQSPPETPRQKRPWFMKALCFPCDLLKWGVRKCFSPSDECMRCVNVAYWIVIIIGGIISAVVALS